MGCFITILVIGLVVYLVMKGKADKREQLAASKRPLSSGSVDPVNFACPFPKCGNCGAASEKMKQQWDGLRKVTWACGYCGHTQIQELKDEELPLSAKQRLGLDGGGMPFQNDQQGGMPGGGAGSGMGGGVGGLLTGMMIGNMMGGGHRRDDHEGGWGSKNDSDWGNNRDGGGNADWGEDDGDDGGDDSGGWGGGDSGGGSDDW